MVVDSDEILPCRAVPAGLANRHRSRNSCRNSAALEAVTNVGVLAPFVPAYFTHRRGLPASLFPAPKSLTVLGACLASRLEIA